MPGQGRPWPQLRLVSPHPIRSERTGMEPSVTASATKRRASSFSRKASA